MISAIMSRVATMTAKPSNEIALGDNKNDILVEEGGNETEIETETETETTANSERLSIIENNIHQVLNLDDQSIKKCTSSGAEDKSEKRSSVAQKFPCENDHNILPGHPSTWPQSPLMIRPTPNSSTKVIGVRLARQYDYENFLGFSAGCILPINNGKEPEGESLVIDFESTHFVGTLFLRIKQAPPVPRGEDDKSSQSEDEINGDQSDRKLQRDYFANKKRKFQALIKGRFKTPLSMSRCVTGQIFERPAGKLPARWIVNNFIKIFSILAPQLDVSLDGNKPRFFSPLVATAHTVLCEEDECKESRTLDSTNSTNLSSHSKERDCHLHLDKGDNLQEPPSVESSSILSDVDIYRSEGITVPDTTSFSATNRSLARKKIFNAMSAKKKYGPRFETHKTYTFEFFQHLLDFGDELAVDMGMVGGMVPLAQATDGQPLKIMAAYKSETGNELESLWSFDIFHESLYSYAKAAFGRMETNVKHPSSS